MVFGGEIKIDALTQEHVNCHLEQLMANYIQLCNQGDVEEFKGDDQILESGL